MQSNRLTPEIIPPTSKQGLQVGRGIRPTQTHPLLKFSVVFAVAWAILLAFLQVRGFVNVLVSRILLIALWIWGFGVCYYVTRISNRKFLYRIVVGILLFLACVGLELLAPKSTPPLEYPKFVEKPSEMTITLGGRNRGFIQGILRSSVEQEKRGFDLPAFDGIIPAHISIENDVVYADVNLFDERRSTAVKVVKNVFTVNRSDWDKNSNSDALEVVTDIGTPIFQMIRKGPGSIVIYGVFRNPKDGRVLISDELNTRSGSVADPKTVHLTPIFKYPSWKYPGKYADGSN